MSRNIILCADGTGNKGGFTPDSNVFKTYNAVDIKPNPNSQITFYDNGVGTSANKFWKSLSGALGFGFQHNVRELYIFLSKNYRATENESDRDKVYCFGFSRGAATVRAFSGFVHDCGLIESHSYENEAGLRAEVNTLMKTYLRARYFNNVELLEKLASGAPVKGCPSPRKKIDIEFIGVWDTVAALGMPKRTDETGIASNLINLLFNRIDDVFNFFMHHRSYRFGLTPNVKRACHALSIDDARTSFWPRVWNESDETLGDVDVDQVWFAGVHSDVGGGYPRQDMSNVPLLWILEQAIDRGLRLNKDALETVRDRANVHDKIHDSRDGFGMFYRYHPREIELLCQDENSRQVKFLFMGEDKAGQELIGSIKIHESVLSRMYHRTAGYAPVYLPPKFDVVDNDGCVKASFDAKNNPDWINHRNYMKKTIKALKELYVYQMSITLFVVSCVIYAWNCKVDYEPRTGGLGELANTLEYFLPDMFNNAIELWVYQQPLKALMVLGIVLLWWLSRHLFRISLRTNAVELRQAVVAVLGPPESDSVEQGSAGAKYWVAFASQIAFAAAIGFVLWRYFSALL